MEPVISFRPSPEAQQRVAMLIEREKAARLSPEGRAEGDRLMELERVYSYCPPWVLNTCC